MRQLQHVATRADHLHVPVILGTVEMVLPVPISTNVSAPPHVMLMPVVPIQWVVTPARAILGLTEMAKLVQVILCLIISATQYNFLF